MATRLAHISDLHFPASNQKQIVSLVESLNELAPDLVVVTGDLTRSGTMAEFARAAEFVDALPGRKLIVPGNHDIPVPGVLARIAAPFARFEHWFGRHAAPLQTEDAAVIGLNTSVGLQPGWDWSLGRAVEGRVAAACAALRAQAPERLRIVACHHPLRPNPLDLRRSRTAGGPAAIAALAAAGMDLLLHGHLHRATSNCAALEGHELCEICANTALSDRPRDGAAGYNIVDIAERRWTVTPQTWEDGRFIPLPQSRDPGGAVNAKPRR